MWQRREALWSESLCWLYPGVVLRVPGHLALNLAAWPSVSPRPRAAGQQDGLSRRKAPLLSEGGGTNWAFTGSQCCFMEKIQKAGHQNQQAAGLIIAIVCVAFLQFSSLPVTWKIKSSFFTSRSVSREPGTRPSPWCPVLRAFTGKCRAFTHTLLNYQMYNSSAKCT